MQIAALVTWVLTATAGATMLAVWVTHGGLGEDTTRFAPPLVFGHVVLAGSGLVLWVLYATSDRDVLAWVAFADLVLVAGLGDVLVTRWLKGRRAAIDPGSGVAVTTALAE